MAKVKKKEPPAKRKPQKRAGRQRQKHQSDSDILQKEDRVKKRPGRRRRILDSEETKEEDAIVKFEEKQQGQVVDVVTEVVDLRKARYKRRSSMCDSEVLESFVKAGLDKEDVQMFKLAIGRLRDEEDLLVSDLPWAHYPHHILS